ncbi:hypothetical protein [Streptomyces sp. NBC_01264]|uniref:hypothetical protein n=1 Tax=Streptomyces sp. NBC_01264 TaxID=2903804 RepID=UPI00224DE07D|nr:hypothetical protein [Streptomyces sp. NBC_01264]MCX4784100.1 hypothetical protein [Streptomyces sp. NBC_01264]
MTQQFNVYVEFDAPDTPLQVFSAIYEDLLEYGGSAGTAPNGNLSVRLFIESPSAVDAGIRGVEYAQAAAMKHKIYPNAVIGFAVLTEEEFDRQLAEPVVPELAGVAEAAEIIKVSPARVSQLERELEPHHVQTLASGPIFLAEGLRRYAATEHNSTRGRRRTEIPLTDIERALLEVLASAAASAEVPSGTEHHQLATEAVEGTMGASQVRLRAQPADSALAVALDSLAGHRLVRTRTVYRKEAAAGREDDLVVTMLGKGLRHAGVDTAPTVGEKDQA